MIVQCKQCHREFHATKYRRVFCSRKCKDTACTKVDVAKLQLFAFQGLEGKFIAEIFKISRPRVTRALRRWGLYEQWREQRYA